MHAGPGQGLARNDYGTIRTLSAEEWKRKKEQYERIAKDHAAKCRYKKANLYLKGKPSEIASRKNSAG